MTEIVYSLNAGPSKKELHVRTGFGGFDTAVRFIVRTHLEENGMQQREAAAGMAVSPSSLSRWLSGEVFWPSDKVEHLMQVIGLRLSVLIVAGSNLQ